MRKSFITFILFLIFVSDAMCATMVASDVDMTNAIEQITIVVLSVFSFLTFIYGAKRVLKFLG